MTLSLPVALTILFITLQLCGVIAWPWILVLAPLWAPIAVAAVVMLGLWVIFAFRRWLFNRRINMALAALALYEKAGPRIEAANQPDTP